MPVLFEEILISRPFKFIIGPDEVPIMVHEAVLAEQSPALAALMRGEMTESITGECRWMDVDQGTFVLFAQFAYTGDYSIPKGSAVVKAKSPPSVLRTLHPPSARSVSPPPSQRPDPFGPFGFIPQPEDEQESHERIFSPKKSKKSKNSPFSLSKSVSEPPKSASEIFNSLEYPLIKSRANTCTCKLPTGDGPVTNSTEVLLTHASLYVLAEKWEVNHLKMLVLSKLHQTLSTLSFGVQEIIDLARYTYSDESTPDLKTEMDGLRKLICLYIAANVEVVSDHNSFMDLIEEGGAFVRDLWKRVVPKK